MTNIKLEELIKYFRNNNLSMSETLYLINLYKLSKNSENDIKKISMQDLFSQLSELNNWLKIANNTDIVSARIKREIEILEKVNQMLQNKELNEIEEIYNEVTFLLYESGDILDSKNTKQLLKFNLKEKE